MSTKIITPKLKKALLAAQHNEITEHVIYRKLAASTRDSHNAKILKKISDDELKHYNVWKGFTGKELKPKWFMVFLYYWIAKIFGITFGMKLMEKGEKLAQFNYEKIAKSIPETKAIIEDENEHEQALLNMLDEERLQYVGSIVLGLNDALVELTGALAGLTFAFQNGQLIAIAGLITGIAASFSMAASEYLSTKAEKGHDKHPIKASVYTGLAYICTVMLLIGPYLLLENLYLSLGIMLLNAILVIFFFTFYVSVAKDQPFRKDFLEMTFISLGVAALSFGIGVLIRTFVGIEV